MPVLWRAAAAQGAAWLASHPMPATPAQVCVTDVYLPDGVVLVLVQENIVSCMLRSCKVCRPTDLGFAQQAGSLIVIGLLRQKYLSGCMAFLHGHALGRHQDDN